MSSDCQVDKAGCPGDPEVGSGKSSSLSLPGTSQHLSTRPSPLTDMAWASHVPGRTRPSPKDCLLSCQNSLSTSKRGQCFESCRSLLRGGGAPQRHSFQTYPSLLSFSPCPEPGLVQLASKAGELGPAFRARQDRAGQAGQAAALGTSKLRVQI